MANTAAEPQPAPVEALDGAPFEAAEPQDAPPPKQKAPDELAELRRENETLRKQVVEREASERFWADRAKGNLPGDGEGAEDDEPESPIVGKADEEPEESADEFLDRLSKEGPRAVAKVAAKIAAKEGYVRKEDVERIARQIVSKEAGKMSADARLMGEYPELKDESSPLFKATAPIYRELVAADPSLKTSQATLFMAAKMAKLQLQVESRSKEAGGDYREERDERRRRIEGQMAPTGRGRSAPIEDEDEMLGPEQRHVISAFTKYGVTEENFTKERSRDRRR